MKLRNPIKDFNWKTNISQMFGVAYNLYFSNFGLPGHNGIDIVVHDDKNGYGIPILATHDFDGVVIESDFPIKTKGNGLYLRKEVERFELRGKEVSYIETCYWHLSDFCVTGKSTGKAGDVIGLMGNTGFVFPKPTQESPYSGIHLHFGLRFRDRFGQILFTDNKYEGYVDPTPYLFEQGQKLPIGFNRNLSLTSEGDDVSWLQTCLELEGLAVNYDPIGVFGKKTLVDVMALQAKHGLTPSIGLVGPKTRTLLNNKYT
jgi:murein DD-endopeptidase MepM/ murein hydrolase activator NlpD